MPSTRLTVSAGFAIAFGALAATGAPAADGVRMTAREVTETLFKADAGTHPDFGAADLNGLDLAELDFKGARLPGANLYGADLSHANLTGTDLKGAHLDRATITSADFSGADLTDARILRPTIFTTLEVVSSEAPKFTGAKLVRIRSDGWLDRADFSGADLTSAVFGGGATREELLFSPASLTSANFTKAILKEAKFPGAKLEVCALHRRRSARRQPARYGSHAGGFFRRRPDRRRHDGRQPRRSRSPQRARPGYGGRAGDGCEHRQGSAGLDALVVGDWAAGMPCDVILGLVPRIHGATRESGRWSLSVSARKASPER